MRILFFWFVIGWVVCSNIFLFSKLLGKLKIVISLFQICGSWIISVWPPFYKLLKKKKLDDFPTNWQAKSIYYIAYSLQLLLYVTRCKNTLVIFSYVFYFKMPRGPDPRPWYPAGRVRSDTRSTSNWDRIIMTLIPSHWYFWGLTHI